MTHFHAVLLDETGCEFGAGIEAETKHEAEDMLRDMYPESRLVQLESPEDTASREAAMHARILDEDYDYMIDEEW
jgi:hypothetical protein